MLPIPIFAYINPGAPSGFVNDFAKILNTENESLLEEKIASFEKATRNEIAIAIIQNLSGDTIENYAEKLFSDWGIGKKNSDNGVLILIAIEDRQMRIEVGYGLEGSLTDAQSIWIINNSMKPAFQKNDFYIGINDAIDKIISATKGEIIPSESADNPLSIGNGFDFFEGIVAFIFVGFSFLGSILSRSKSWWAGGIVGAIIGIITGFYVGFIPFGILLTITLTLLGLAFDHLVSGNYARMRALGKNPSWWAGGRGFGGSSGSGGFGGGRSGGGGASGRW